MLSVYSAGRIPGGYVTNHIYTWVDPQGRSISPPSGLPQTHGSTLRQSEGDSRSTLNLLQGGDEKKVSCPVMAPASRLGMEGWWGRLAPSKPRSPDQTQNREASRRLDTGAWFSRVSVLLSSPLKGFIVFSSLFDLCSVYSDAG